MLPIQYRIKSLFDKIPHKGQPPNSGQVSMHQFVLYSEVTLYMDIYIYIYIYIYTDSEIIVSTRWGSLKLASIIATCGKHNTRLYVRIYNSNSACDPTHALHVHYLCTREMQSINWASLRVLDSSIEIIALKTFDS